MRSLGFSVAMTALCLTAACATAPPKSRQVANDPLLQLQGGVLLLIDVCVQRDGLGNGDYFVINEAESGGRAALEILRKELRVSDIRVRAELIAVCAARVNKDGAPLNVADSVGDKRRQAQQPLRMSGTDMEDPRYVKALSTMSTYAFERAAAQDKKKAADQDAAEAAPPSAVSMDDFRAAAEVVKNKTQTSSVLFLGALGNSRTAGKAAAQFVGSMVVGLGTAIATAGLGTGYYLIFMPGHKADGVVMEGALINLESGELTWSKAIKTGGDPVHPKAVANPEALGLLFHDIMFKPVPGQAAAPAKP